MANRSFEEIQADVRHASSISDAEALHRYAMELEHISTPMAEALAISTYGVVLSLRGDFHASLESYGRALALYVELGDRSNVASVTGNTGTAHFNTGNYPAALEHYHRALALHEELGNRSGVTIDTGNIGVVHAATSDYPAALEHFHRVLALHEDLGERSGLAGVTCNIGLVHAETGDYTAALEC